MNDSRRMHIILLTLMLVQSFALTTAMPCLAAPDDQSELTIDAGVQTPAITITAIEATGAVIQPEQAYYHLDQPANVVTTITWNDAGVVDSIVDNSDNTLMQGVDYKVSFLNGTATLSILDGYLAPRLLEAGDEVQLIIRFDSYSPATFNITAVSGKVVVEHTLTISSTVGGSVSEPGEGVFTYDAGSVVDLLAVADEGYHFSGWSGDVGSVAEVDAAATSITIDVSYSIAAGFAPETGEFAVNSRPIGAVMAAAVAAAAVIFFVRRRRVSRTAGL